MSKRLPNPVLPEGLATKLLLRCMVCDKSIEGFYARYGDSGVCSGKCMKVQDQKPRYPGFSEEEFLQRQGVGNGSRAVRSARAKAC